MIKGAQKRMSASGCLSSIIFVIASAVVVFLVSLGYIRIEARLAWMGVFLAIVFDIGLVSLKMFLKKSKEKRKQAIQDSISEFINRYMLKDTSEQIRVLSIVEVDSPLVDTEVVSCVNQYIHETMDIEKEIITLKEKTQEILCHNQHFTEEERLEYLKEKEPELKLMTERLQNLRILVNGRKIVLNETTSQEIECIRKAIQEIGKSRKVRNISNREWKSATDVFPPEELLYFTSATTPVILRLKEFCFCIFSKTILAFTLDGKFVTALQRNCFMIQISRDWERVYFDVKRNTYSGNAVDNDSKRIKTGDERFTWPHVRDDGTKDTNFWDNPSIIYRYDTMEYGRIRISVADFTEDFKFSSANALAVAEKASVANAKCTIARETNNKTALISLLQVLAPLSKQVRKLEERYTKLDIPQKKYCYIERS